MKLVITIFLTLCIFSSNAQRVLLADKLRVSDSLTIGGVPIQTVIANAAVVANQTAINAKAPLVSPSFTGTPTAPTATVGTNSTQIASTAFVQSQAAKQIIDSSTNLSNGEGIKLEGNKDTIKISTNTITLTTTIDYPAIPTATTSSVDVNVSGADVLDMVSIGLPAAIGYGLFYKAWVSSTGVVRIEMYNSSGATIDPASAAFKIKVFK